jgi:hypothetical protein
MSTDYCPLPPIRFADLFDGRLKEVGIYEYQPQEQTSDERCLTDGRNFLWVYSDEHGSVTFTPCGGNAPQRILRAIADKFDVDIVSEHQPQYWGYETEEEWDAACAARAEKQKQDFYNDVVRFVCGQSNGISPGTIGMIKAKIARQLVAESPGLLDEDRRPELIKAVEMIYYRDHAVVVTLSEQDLDFARMVATHEDDLPQAQRFGLPLGSEQ